MTSNQTPAIDVGVAINQAHGQAVESRQAIRQTADLLRSQLQQTAGKAQSAIGKGARDALGRLSRQAGKAQGAIDQALMDMSGQLQQSIENAVVPLITLGVDLPTDATISQIKAQHAQELQASRSQIGLVTTATVGTTGGPTGVGTPVVPVQPNGVTPIICTCDVHKLPDEFTREQYRFLIKYVAQPKYAVCNRSDFSVTELQTYKVVAVLPKWWQAELCCKLLNDCKWDWTLIQTYWQAIIRVDLYSNQPGVNMGDLCKNAPTALNQLLTQLNA